VGVWRKVWSEVFKTIISDSDKDYEEIKKRNMTVWVRKTSLSESCELRTEP
jgi:hypothetical protein